MTNQRLLRFHLDDGLRQSAEAGQHNFIALVAKTVREAGYMVEYRKDSPAEIRVSARGGCYTLLHMADPAHDRALTMRRVYYYPFWAIEPSAKRWQWHVADSVFPVCDVPRRQAEKFYDFWRQRLFGEAPARASRDGFIYVPLQGRLLDHRSFQACSPIDMLRAVLIHDPRPVVATLHPNETYEKADQRALLDLKTEFPRLRIESGNMEHYLTTCDHVVTQNSSAAFAGFFFAKPAVLFGRIDFHHIAANVSELGVKEALRCGPRLTPDYAGYLHWFWQVMSINAGRPNAPEKIRAALIRAGWPM